LKEPNKFHHIFNSRQRKLADHSNFLTAQACKASDLDVRYNGVDFGSSTHFESRPCSTGREATGCFFATCARLIGPEVKLTIEQNYAGLSPNELVLVNEVTAAINEGLPNAANRPPGEVLCCPR
jgi:hypothetical protein